MESINKTQYIYRRTQGVMSFSMYFGITCYIPSFNDGNKLT